MKQIDKYVNPPKGSWKSLCQRCEKNDNDINEVVAKIIAQVKTGGDEAIKEITQRIDGYAPGCLMMSDEQRVVLEQQVSPQLRQALINAKSNIEKFHEAQMPLKVEIETVPGVLCMQVPVALDTVGLYIPGGKAPLFSTVLMLAVPAKLAGCRRVVMCTPARRDGSGAPEIVCAANICGVDAIYTIGGAQAIAAMAYGTDTVPKVDKIFGPGNRFVTKAKQMVSTDQVAIDMPAGPSEVMILADATAVPEFVAADFLSQAEHGDDSQAILVCDSLAIGEAVEAAVAKQIATLTRRETVVNALANSRIIVFDEPDSREQITSFANAYAPEHLIISMRDPWEIASGIRAAGSVFIGNYSPESAGDYASGTNHTLPTSGWAVAYSGVNIDSFMHKITYQQLTPDGLNTLAYTITTMAEAEGLDAHAAAVKVRLQRGGMA